MGEPKLIRRQSYPVLDRRKPPTQPPPETTASSLQSTNLYIHFYIHIHRLILLADRATMKASTIATFLLFPFAALAADGDAAPGLNPPPEGQCSNYNDKKVCDTCITTEVPFTSTIPAWSASWTETKVLCTGAPKTTACTTPTP